MKFSKFDKRMFETALKVAETSTFKTFHMGCVITYGKHIVSMGVNSYKTNPTQKEYNMKYRKFSKSEKPIVDSVHAEIDALQKIARPLYFGDINPAKLNLYIARIAPGREGGIGLARPCPACMNLLRDKGIKNIYYTTNDNSFVYEEIS